MTLKELSGVAEAVRAMNFTPEILGVSIMEEDFPTVHITEDEYCKHFGRTLAEPFSDEFDKMSTVWSGAKILCLVPKK